MTRSAMKRRQIQLLLLALVVIAILAVNFWPAPRRLDLTGIVTTDDVIVSSEIGGRIQHLTVDVGDTVKVKAPRGVNEFKILEIVH